MISIITQIIANGLGIYLAYYFIEGVSFTGDVISLLIAGLVLGIFNFVIKPIAKIISAPLIVLTIGVFTLVINIGILWLLQAVMPELAISGFWAYIWTLIIVSTVNWVIHSLV